MQNKTLDSQTTEMHQPLTKRPSLSLRTIFSTNHPPSVLNSKIKIKATKLRQKLSQLFSHPKNLLSAPNLKKAL